MSESIQIETERKAQEATKTKTITLWRYVFEDGQKSEWTTENPALTIQRGFDKNVRWQSCDVQVPE